ncbi:ORF6N domain-containing protein [bacterium]|nr:ORF6N domain-containing protein [bacterium]
MNEVMQIKNLIYTIRGHRVMLDSDLAMLYEVETKHLNRAVKRNIERFPCNFMFQLTKEEYDDLKVRCQIVTSPKGGGRQYLPYVFTEQGVAMLSSVLTSKRAIQVNIQIMNTFVQMRQWAIENKDMAQRLSELEHYFIEHCEDNKRDNEETRRHLKNIYEAIGLLMDRTKPTKIGFVTDNKQ